MTDDELQNKLISEIDDKIRTEKEINDVADKVSRDLSLTGKARAVFQDKDYMFRARHTDTTIIIIVADALRFQILGERYRPAFIKGEIENNLTYQENVRATVAAYFRHITGLIQPEILN